MHRIAAWGWSIALLLGGCLPSLERACGGDADCPAGSRCLVGYCVAGDAAGDGALTVDGGPRDGAPGDATVDRDGALPPDGTPPDADLADARSPDTGPACLPGETDEQPCPGGIRVRACMDGEWGDFGACHDPDACEPGDRRPCAEGSAGCDAAETCGEDGWGPCVSETEPPPEICNDLDDDCDGRTDEGYDLTADARHCGGCNVICAAERAEVTCAGGTCAITGCEPGAFDADGVYRNGCECIPEGPDEPDPTFADTDCDGVDGDAGAAIFVSAEHGDDAADGSRTAPLRTLTAAIAAGEAQDLPVLLDAGTYPFDELIRVETGVRLHGGYRYDGVDRWTRAGREENPTILSGPAVALRFRRLQRDTLLDNLIVRSADAPEGQSSVAIVAHEVGDRLVLRDVRVEAGRGGAGGMGAPGSDGGAGENGQPGVVGAGGMFGSNPGCMSGSSGGGGGAPGAANGGTGGGGQRICPQGVQCDGAAGGAGATVVTDSRDGDHGAPGFAGAPAVQSTHLGLFSRQALVWMTVPAAPGADGLPGGGGGGGGGGVDVNIGGLVPGAGGSGGGAGGCGGTAGENGGHGGASIGILVVSGRVRMVRGELIAGDGGRGGRGGAGGLGGRGGEGAARALPDRGFGAGGAGGAGGQGGCGGHGAGGHGGPAFGALRVTGVGDLQASRLFREEEGVVQVGMGGPAGAGGERPQCAGRGPPGTNAVALPVACCGLLPDDTCDALRACN